MRVIVAFGVAVLTGTLASKAGGLDDGCPGGQSEPVFSEAGTTEEDAARFLGLLQAAVASDDRKRVVSMVEFPIEAWCEGRDVTFRSAADLTAAYARVFTARLAKTISAARVQCLFVNSQGIMIHDGEVWLRAVEGKGLRIVRINGAIGND